MIMSVIPTAGIGSQAKMLLVLAFCLGLVGSHLWAYNYGGSVMEDRLTVKHLEEQTRNLQAQADAAYAYQSQLNGALENAKKRNVALLADRRAVDAASDRLQRATDHLTTRLPDDTSETLRRYTNALGVVFSACQKEYALLGEDADRSHDAATTLYDGWPGGMP